MIFPIVLIILSITFLEISLILIREKTKFEIVSNFLRYIQTNIFNMIIFWKVSENIVEFWLSTNI